ncbi:MAG: ribonucleoside-diphosphate reductase beta chain [bacterium]|nr:ribonucleoside-diphosphate reductase beta chain [bacterium]
MAFDLFRPEIDDQHPRLERLFEQAKQDFWNDSTAIDWSQPLTLTPDERVAMAKILSLIYYGERAALEVSAQLVPLVDEEQSKFVLACQVIEEAKHVSAFRRLLKKLDDIHPANPWVRRVLSDLVATKHASYKLVGMQLIVENIANQLFHIIHEHVQDPLIRKVLEYVGRDEKKHTGLAVLYLPKILKQVGFVESHMLWAKQIYWTFCVSQAIWDHRREAAALGIDIQQGLRKGIAAQDHLVEQMGIRRGIFKSKTLENLVLSVYDRERSGKRGKWTQPQSRTSSSS